MTSAQLSGSATWRGGVAIGFGFNALYTFLDLIPALEPGGSADWLGYLLYALSVAGTAAAMLLLLPAVPTRAGRFVASVAAALYVVDNLMVLAYFLPHSSYGTGFVAGVLGILLLASLVVLGILVILAGIGGVPVGIALVLLGILEGLSTLTALTEFPFVAGRPFLVIYALLYLLAAIAVVVGRPRAAR